MEENVFNPQDMIERFHLRAEAVKKRTLPPVEGAERQMIRKQMQLDYQDFAMLADATWHLEGSILTLNIDLGPTEDAKEK